MIALDDNRHARTSSATWLLALRTYLGITIVGNLAWESLHLPLYTIWRTGTTREQAFAVLHCTLGDLLIALSALTLALLIFADHAWPMRRFWRAAGAALIFGIGYTIFSEWLNVVVRASWAYSEWMPVVSLFGQTIGLSPLLQWMLVPAAAFGLARGIVLANSKVPPP